MSHSVPPESAGAAKPQAIAPGTSNSSGDSSGDSSGHVYIFDTTLRDGEQCPAPP